MKPELGEVIVEDSEDFRGGDALGIKEISLEQYRRCAVEGSKEMVKAGTIRKLVRGQSVQIDIPDQRDVFINSVKMLECILMPDLMQNQDLMEKLKESNGEIKKIDTGYHQQIKDEMQKARRYHNPTEPRKIYSLTQDRKDIIETEWYNKFVILYRERLIILALLLHKLNYYSEGGVSA